jgi:hypothetical protein
VTHVQYPQEDLQSMVGLLRLLLQKEQCIAQLREMNNKAESVTPPPSLEGSPLSLSFRSPPHHV